MNIKISKNIKKRAIIASLVFAGILFGGMHQQSESASLTNVSVTLSNSQLSFSGALAAGNTVGSSQVIIDTTTGNWPSTTSAQLVSGDTDTDDDVGIGNAGTISTYSITSINNASTFNVTPVLASGDTETGDIVIATRSATQTIRFTTANAIAEGAIRILVPAVANDADSQDGLPDAGNFDFSNSAPTVTCPGDLAGYDFVAGTASASAITIGSQDYHAFECRYSGTGAIGTVFDGTTNGAIVIDDLINPAPKVAHTTGLADTYRILIQHLSGGTYAVTDSTTASIGVIEAVRVTASVAPQITFQISGVASGVTACGVTTDVTTTAAAVPLGELSISAFTDAAQALAVSTNATNGYAVTTRANDQLGRDAQVCTGDNTGADCIPDATGNGTNISHTASGRWDDTTYKGFGFSLDDVNTSGVTPVFEYDTTSGNCSGGTYCARQFADTEDSQAAQQIFSSTTVASDHNLYVCYRAVISATQAAGDYENHIIYTATATF